ncbi:hypothetical protein [Limosilactobacillus pontis]|uniref:hypothetical protein n=1 Tax=Limosilactobacillus pontis TaxID=35787 RepID=UPI002F2685F5
MNEKNVITNLHWSIEQYDNADYYELSRILQAKDRKNRPVDPLTSILHIRAAQAKRDHR